MIDRLFKTTENDELVFDATGVEWLTNNDFAAGVYQRIRDNRVSEMRLAGDRRQQFVYFSVGLKMYSFAYNKKKRELLFSERLLRPGRKTDWRLVIGWRSVV